MSRRISLGFSVVVPMLGIACAREPVSLGGDNAPAGQAGVGLGPIGTGGTGTAEGGQGQILGAGGSSHQPAVAGSGNQQPNDAGAGSQPTPECVVGGCSSQLCVERDATGLSTCEWLEEYACYRTATCEPQADGRCGWTQTAELTRCILAARQGAAGGGTGPGPVEPAGGTGGRVDGTGGSGGQTNCYSPEQNLDHAYDGTMQGCACSGASSICISGVALLCDQGRWLAVEDGPCMPQVVTCTGEVETAQQCLDLFQECIPLDSGGFCGLTAITGFCDKGRIVPSAAECLDVAAASYCHVLDNGSWCTGLQAESCPEGWSRMQTACPSGVSWCVQVGSLGCELPSWNADECTAAGATVRSDPGDGSFVEAGCPEGEIELAEVSGCNEGCLCCHAGADRRIGIREATALISDWAFRDKPDMNPPVSFDVVEYDVPGLWAAIRVQLFYAEYVSSDGQRFNAALFAYYKGELYPFGVTVGSVGLMSGVLRGQTFYYTYAWGSGIHRSVIGKLTVEGEEPRFLETGGFRDRDMFVEWVDDVVVVKVGAFVEFNEWSEPETFGTLRDQDGVLTVVDSEGKEIAAEF